MKVCKALIKHGHYVVISTAAPHAFFEQQLPAEGYAMRSALLDCGAFQLDAFTVDMKRTLPPRRPAPLFLCVPKNSEHQAEDDDAQLLQLPVLDTTQTQQEV